MSFKQLKTYLVFVSLLSTQLFALPQALGQTMSAEEFITQLKESGDIGIFDSASVSVFNSTCATVVTPIEGQELNAFCDVVVNSPACEDVPEEDRLDCTDMDESRDFNALEFIRGCTTGIFEGVMDILNFVWDVLGWVWDTIRAPGEAIQEASEYIDSVKLYLVNEYDQAYEEASSPFRSLKAAKAVAGSIFDMLISSIQDFLYQEYQDFGCMNFEARTNTMCQVMTEIIVPPVSALYLIKGAYNLVRRPSSLRNFIRSERSGPRRFEQQDLAEASLRRSLTDTELEAIDRAHLVGAGEIGLDGGPAGIGNYTLAQLRRKNEILREAGLSSQEIRTLMEEGVVGISGGGLRRLFSRGDDGDTRGVGTDPDRSASPLRLSSNTESPEINEFREAFNRGEFPGESSYISYSLTPVIREPVRVIRREGDGLLVERRNGTTFTLGPDELATARTSSSALEEFGLARTVGEVRYTMGERVMIPRSNGGSSPGRITLIHNDGRALVEFTENGVNYEKTVALGDLRRLNPLDVDLPSDPRPDFNAFREAFNNNDFTGDAQYVSFMELGERVAARVTRVDRHGLRLEVAGSSPVRHVMVRDLSELEQMKVSSTARDYYRAPPSDETSTILSRRVEPAMNRSPDELLSPGSGAPSLEIATSTGRHYQAEIIERRPDGNVDIRIFRDGEFHSTATVSPSELRPYTPRSGRYNVQRIIDEFRSRVERPEYTTADHGIKDFNFTQGRTRNFIHYPNDISVARRQGRVFDNVAPSDLPPGNYTYVITDTGEVSFGLVTDGLEFGVKHVHIAQGRRVAVAGEVRIGPNKEITYNELSGTFTNQAIQLARQGGQIGYDEELLNLARRFFETDPNGASVTRTRESVFPGPPNNQPRPNDIRHMCEYLRQTAQTAQDLRYQQLRSLEVCQ